LDYVIVEAESGEMGGSGSHQFTIPCQSGEDVIVHTEDGSYAANLEKAAVDPLPKEKAAGDIPPPQEVHTPNIGSIEAVCAFLKTQPKDMIKTLIYAADETVIAALVRGDHELNPEKLTQVLGGKHAELADEATIQTVTGHAELADEATIQTVTGAKVGFAGPTGTADKVSEMIIDYAVAAMAVGVTGANKTDYHVRNVVPGRDFPLKGENIIVADIRNAVEGDTHNGKNLLFRRGIEVGQVFKLGTKYSEKLSAKVLDEKGVEKPCLMGCYGIGINRIVASAIETGSDKNGIIWPVSIAPFEVLITSVNQDDEDVANAARQIYQQLLDKGVDVLLDDRDVRGGVKFKDADLIGIPVRVTVGKRSVAEGNAEIKLRRESESRKAPIDQAALKTIELVKSLKEPLNS
ncbi:MAG: proline--tRNA ligase, partial [Planctomycetota bacterium]